MRKTKISAISAVGAVLTDKQLTEVAGGAPPIGGGGGVRRCWEQSTSIGHPGQDDKSKDYVVD